MNDNEFRCWTDWNKFIILPYIGISWGNGWFEICAMWAFFNSSLTIEIK